MKSRQVTSPEKRLKQVNSDIPASPANKSNVKPDLLQVPDVSGIPQMDQLLSKYVNLAEQERLEQLSPPQKVKFKDKIKQSIADKIIYNMLDSPRSSASGSRMSSAVGARSSKRVKPVSAQSRSRRTAMRKLHQNEQAFYQASEISSEQSKRSMLGGLHSRTVSQPTKQLNKADNKSALRRRFSELSFKASHRGKVNDVFTTGSESAGEDNGKDPFSDEGVQTVLSGRGCNCAVCHYMNKKEHRPEFTEEFDLTKCFQLGQKQIRHVQSFAGKEHAMAAGLQVAAGMHTLNSPKSSSTQPLLSPASSCEESTIIKSATSATELRLEVEIEKKTFNWLMHHMLPPTYIDDKVAGCEVNFPDTAFFAEENGQGLAGSVCKDILKTDQYTGCLFKITQQNKLTIQALRTTFSNIVRDRWKNTSVPIGLFDRRKKMMRNMTTTAAAVNAFKKMSSSVSPVRRFLTNVSGQEAKTPLNKSISVVSDMKLKQNSVNMLTDNGAESAVVERVMPTKNRDQVILRFRDGYGPNGHYSETGEMYQMTKALSEVEFFKQTVHRNTDPFWTFLDSIQTCVKAKRALGKHFPVNFRPFAANGFSDFLTNSKLRFDFRKHDQPYLDDIQQEIVRQARRRKPPTHKEIMRELERRMRIAEPEKYCERVCLKMAFYLQSFYQEDLIHMNADFFQDENGQIWLFHARDVIVRRSQVDYPGKNPKKGRSRKPQNHIEVIGNRFIDAMKENMRAKGLQVDEARLREARRKRRLEAKNRDPRQIGMMQLTKLREKIDIAQFSEELAQLEESGELYKMTQEEFDYATRKLSKENFQRLEHRMRLRGLENDIEAIYVRQLRESKLPPNLQSNIDQPTVKRCDSDDSDSGKDVRVQKILGITKPLTAHELERAIIDELRPGMPAGTRLASIIREESGDDFVDLVRVDDRIRKFLERRFGTQKRATTQFLRNQENKTLLSQKEDPSALTSLKVDKVNRREERQLIVRGYKKGEGFIDQSDVNERHGMGGATQAKRLAKLRLQQAKQSLIDKMTNQPEVSEADTFEVEVKQRLIAIAKEENERQRKLKDEQVKVSTAFEDYQDFAERHQVYKSIINREPRSFTNKERVQAKALRDAVRKKLHAALVAHTRVNPPGLAPASETFLTNVPPTYYDQDQYTTRTTDVDQNEVRVALRNLGRHTPLDQVRSQMDVRRKNQNDKLSQLLVEPKAQKFRSRVNHQRHSMHIVDTYKRVSTHVESDLKDLQRELQAILTPPLAEAVNEEKLRLLAIPAQKRRNPFFNGRISQQASVMRQNDLADQFGPTAAGESTVAELSPRDTIIKQAVETTTTTTRDGNIVVCDKSFLEDRDMRQARISRSVRILKVQRDELPWNKTRRQLNEFYKKYPKQVCYRTKPHRWGHDSVRLATSTDLLNLDGDEREWQSNAALTSTMPGTIQMSVENDIHRQFQLIPSESHPVQAAQHINLDRMPPFGLHHTPFSSKMRNLKSGGHIPRRLLPTAVNTARNATSEVDAKTERPHSQLTRNTEMKGQCSQGSSKNFSMALTSQHPDLIIVPRSFSKRLDPDPSRVQTPMADHEPREPESQEHLTQERGVSGQSFSDGGSKIGDYSEEKPSKGENKNREIIRLVAPSPSIGFRPSKPIKSVPENRRALSQATEEFSQKELSRTQASKTHWHRVSQETAKMNAQNFAAIQRQFRRFRQSKGVGLSVDLGTGGLQSHQVSRYGQSQTAAGGFRNQQIQNRARNKRRNIEMNLTANMFLDKKGPATSTEQSKFQFESRLFSSAADSPKSGGKLGANEPATLPRQRLSVDGSIGMSQAYNVSATRSKLSVEDRQEAYNAFQELKDGTKSNMTRPEAINVLVAEHQILNTGEDSRTTTIQYQASTQKITTTADYKHNSACMDGRRHSRPGKEDDDSKTDSATGDLVGLQSSIVLHAKLADAKASSQIIGNMTGPNATSRITSKQGSKEDVLQERIARPVVHIKHSQKSAKYRDANLSNNGTKVDLDRYIGPDEFDSPKSYKKYANRQIGDHVLRNDALVSVQHDDDYPKQIHVDAAARLAELAAAGSRASVRGSDGGSGSRLGGRRSSCSPPHKREVDVGRMITSMQAQQAFGGLTEDSLKALDPSFDEARGRNHHTRHARKSVGGQVWRGKAPRGDNRQMYDSIDKIQSGDYGYDLEVHGKAQSAAGTHTQKTVVVAGAQAFPSSPNSGLLEMHDLQMMIDVTVEHKGNSRGQSPSKSQKRYLVGKTVSTRALKHGTQILLPIDDSNSKAPSKRPSTNSKYPPITEIIREAQQVVPRRSSSHMRSSIGRSLRVSIDKESKK